MRGKLRNFVAGILSISLLTIVASINAAPRSGSDAALRSFFFTHRAEFDKLVAMAEKDGRVTRIAPDFTWLNDSVAWPRKDIGFSTARWNEYRDLFRRLNLPTGISKSINPTRIFCPVILEGSVPTGDEKGFVYSQAPLGPTLESLDERPPVKFWNGPDRSHVLVYKPLEGHWYLYYEQW